MTLIGYRKIAAQGWKVITACRRRERWIKGRMRLLPGLLLALCFAPLAHADIGGQITWPVVTPPGENSAINPAPRIEWVDRFTQNLKSAPQMPSIDLIFDGDSITDWWTTNGKALWDQKYAPLHAFDFAIAGDRTETVLWRLQNGQIGSNVHAKLVFLMIGTNNWTRNRPEEVAAAVKAIIDRYHQLLPDATVVLQAIFPRGESASDPARAWIKDTNKILSTMAGDKVIYLDFGDKFLRPDGTLSRDIMGDFLHPTMKGYQIWADAIQPTLEKFYPGASK